MASRKLTDLERSTYLMAEAFSCECAKRGVDMLIYCTYRSKGEQYALWLQGRRVDAVKVERARHGLPPITEREAQKKVTWAAPGLSWHNYGRAFDVVPLSAGRPVWDSKSPVWLTLGEIGESVGLEWGGRWSSKPDFPHFQCTGRKKIQEYMA